MTYAKFCFQIGIGLVLCMFWITPSAQARADAVSESPFTFDPPAGWRRNILEDGTVRFNDPEDPGNPGICMLQIMPHIPRIGHGADEAWLREFFNLEHQKRMKGLNAPEFILPSRIDPVFERIANRKYVIHENFNFAITKNSSFAIINFRLMILLKDSNMQTVMSLVSPTQCRAAINTVQEFFDKSVARAVGEWKEGLVEAPFC